MPLSACKPISAVPPSPPCAITFASFCLPSAFKATSMPAATAAEFSNSEWMKGTSHDDCGNLVVNPPRPPVASVTIILEPAAPSTSFAASASPQPVQAVCPDAKSVHDCSFGAVSVVVIKLFPPLLLIHPLPYPPPSSGRKSSSLRLHNNKFSNSLVF